MRNSSTCSYTVYIMYIVLVGITHIALPLVSVQVDLISHYIYNRILDSLVVKCTLRVREVPGSIPSQGPRHTKDNIKMVPIVPLFSTEHSKGKILALSQELR